MEWLILLIIALAVGGVVWAVMESLNERSSARRLEMIASGSEPRKEEKGLIQRLLHSTKDDRRRKLEESLRTLDEKGSQKKRVTLRQRLQRAGLHLSTTQFLLFAASLGVGLGLVGLLIGAMIFDFQSGLIIGLAMLGVGGVGLPLWMLRFLSQRRMNKFLHHLPDAIELMVRGLRSGLPVTDAMKTIAEEVPDPVGPEFMEVVEGQKIGIPIDKGLERMYERVPLPEVNFLYIVLSIQKETGGNLSEALSNLSTVLRSRKAMKLKVKAISQEAKVSAFIIGAIPVVLIGALAFLNPGYLTPMYTTSSGKMASMAAAFWMAMGVLIMRKIINFKF